VELRGRGGLPGAAQARRGCALAGPAGADQGYRRPYESQWFWEAFPDQHLDNRPYRIFFASGDYTCSVARFTGTMTGTLRNWAGDEIPPTGKSFEVDFYTVALWNDGQIVEENLMYDLVTFLKQLGLSG